MPRGLRRRQERAAQVDADDFVKGLHIALADRRQRHDARVVDDHINVTEGLHWKNAKKLGSLRSMPGISIAGPPH
jgi:hypothetical protein